MKRGISVLLLSVYFFTATGFSQLVRLPVLLHHYLEHQEKNENTGFGEFLSLHYLEDTQDKDLHHDHERLPFKSQHILVPCVQHASAIQQLNLCEPHLAVKQVPAIPQDDIYAAPFSGKIWQPPRA
ncbi:MAG: hypothetical protein JNL57_06640 [Bacteroidetes bacterium]|nr:hypothetical protein [Bacteroidota bacterium]